MIEKILLNEARRIARAIGLRTIAGLFIKSVTIDISQEIPGLLQSVFPSVFPREYKFVNWSYNSFDKTLTCAKCGWRQLAPSVEEALRVYEKHQLGISPWPKCPVKKHPVKTGVVTEPEQA